MLRISAGVMDLSIVGCDREPECLVSPGGEVGERRGRVGGWIGIAVRDRDLGGCELGFELFGELRALVALVRQLDELGLDLRTEQRAQLFGIDLGLIASTGPGRQAVPVVAGGLALRSIAQISQQRDP